MKHFPIKKSKLRKKVFIQDSPKTFLPKPKMPLFILWKVSESKNIYFDWVDIINK